MDAPVSSGGVEEHEPERSLPWDHPWGHTLRPEIEAMIYEEPTDLIQVSKTLREAAPPLSHRPRAAGARRPGRARPGRGPGQGPRARGRGTRRLAPRPHAE